MTEDASAVAHNRTITSRAQWERSSMALAIVEGPMSMNITHFMWGYQPHFRVRQQLAAERVFRMLDPAFDPEVFLVGILADPTKETFPACVEPENDFWISSEDFNGVPGIAEELHSTYPERQIMQSHPLAQKWQDEGLCKRSLQDAILRVIHDHPAKPPGLSFWASFPMRIDNYWVSLVLGLQNSVIASHYTLKKGSVAMHEYRNVTVPTSLTKAAVLAFLRETADALQKPNPGCGDNIVNAEELLRAAADSLMTGVVWRIDRNRIEGMHALFRDCNTISSLHYEKAAGKGTIILARRDHPAVSLNAVFAAPTRLGNYRTARKLLELASGDLALACDSEEIHGLATVQGYDGNDEDLFCVRVLEHHHWELAHEGNPIMRVKYGQPYLPKRSFDEKKLRADLPRIFKGLTAEKVDELTALVKEAEHETHGTMLLISESAEAEAKRLGTQATPLVPCNVTPHLLRHLTPIDGAILIAPDGFCHAIGTILDGMATDQGDPGRGARFNSAVRYVATAKTPSLAVVISEDGGVDFVPNLRPAIERARIDQSLAELRAIRDGSRVNKRRFGALMQWADKHRFYLRAEDCQELNELITEIDSKIDAQAPSSIKIVRRAYVPDPEMDESVYYLQQ